MCMPRLSAPLLLVALWAGLLITFLVVRPSPGSTRFWLLTGSTIVCGGLYMLASHRENRRTQRATLTWLARISELVDVRDFIDDGHLAEYLDAAEQRRVIEELERMPGGSRSLRRAIELVAPDLLAND